MKNYPHNCCFKLKDSEKQFLGYLVASSHHKFFTNEVNDFKGIFTSIGNLLYYKLRALYASEADEAMLSHSISPKNGKLSY